MKKLLPVLALALLAACSTGGDEPLPPAAYDQPVLNADGTLSGIQGIDSRHWALVDADLRKGIFWYAFANRLTRQCPEAYPEHKDWLGEVNLLVQRASGQAARTGIGMERARLQTLAEGADRAAVGLEAMTVAEMDIATVVRGWIRSATGDDVADGDALLKGCGLLFDRDNLRGLLRNATQPLSAYYNRIRDEHPEIFDATRGAEGIARRLEKI